MDALAALWLTSIIGAAGFTATGFFLARSRMPRENAEDSEPRASKEPIAGSVRPPAASTRPPLPEPAELSAKVPSKVPVATSDRPKDPRRDDDDDTAGSVDVLAAPAEKPKASDTSVKAAGAASAESIELERQLDALRVELRAEVVARHTVEARSKELEARLSSMSQQVAALRARSSADAGAVRRDSMVRGASLIPGANNADQRNRLSTRAPGLFAEIDDLKADIARLKSENESLRAAALGAPPPAPRASGPRSDFIVPDVLKGMVERIARIDGVRAAAVVENNGLVLASSGERAEALAAFGNYIRDAASRSTRLLPLGTAEEVMVRDVHGVVVSSRVLGRPDAELALITLAFSAVPARELREIVGQTPGLGPDAISAR